MPTITISSASFVAMTKQPNPALTRAVQAHDDGTLSFDVDEDTLDVLRSIDSNIEAACRKARWIGLQALPPKAKAVAAPKAPKAPRPAPSAPKAAPKAQAKPKAAAKPAPKAAATSWTPRAGSKAETFIAMLTRPQGATQEELMAATGWVDHTVRGFMGNCKTKQGIVIGKSKGPDGKPVYKIEGQTAPRPAAPVPALVDEEGF
jgi:hypothetical protein